MAALFIPHHDIFAGNYTIVRRDSTHEFRKEEHYHDFYEIQFYLSESEDNRIGTIRLNEKEYSLYQGCLILINMFTPHQIRITTKDPYIRYCISFDTSLLLFASSEKSNLFNIFSNYGSGKYLQMLTPSQIRTFLEIYNRHENMPQHNGRDIMEKALILEIFSNVYDIFYNGDDISPLDSRNMRIVSDLVSYITDNLGSDLSLEVLAQRENFSTFHLSRMFKKYTGTTLNKYIVNKRIDKAKLLLRDSGVDSSIAEISEQVGFNNYTHFYRTFLTITGQSPAEYREHSAVTRDRKT